MASYDMNKINASLLKQYKDSFNDESNHYNTVSYDTFFSSYLNNCSDPFIQNMSIILKRDYEQIKKGYTSIISWWNSYNSGIKELEDKLATGTLQGTVFNFDLPSLNYEDYFLDGIDSNLLLFYDNIFINNLMLNNLDDYSKLMELATLYNKNKAVKELIKLYPYLKDMDSPNTKTAIDSLLNSDLEALTTDSLNSKVIDIVKSLIDHGEVEKELSFINKLPKTNIQLFFDIRKSITGDYSEQQVRILNSKIIEYFSNNKMDQGTSLLFMYEDIFSLKNYDYEENFKYFTHNQMYDAATKYLTIINKEVLEIDFANQIINNLVERKEIDVLDKLLKISQSNKEVIIFDFKDLIRKNPQYHNQLKQLYEEYGKYQQNMYQALINEKLSTEDIIVVNKYTMSKVYMNVDMKQFFEYMMERKEAEKAFEVAANIYLNPSNYESSLDSSLVYFLKYYSNEDIMKLLSESQKNNTVLLIDTKQISEMVYDRADSNLLKEALNKYYNYQMFAYKNNALQNINDEKLMKAVEKSIIAEKRLGIDLEIDYTSIVSQSLLDGQTARAMYLAETLNDYEYKLSIDMFDEGVLIDSLVEDGATEKLTSFLETLKTYGNNTLYPEDIFNYMEKLKSSDQTNLYLKIKQIYDDYMAEIENESDSEAYAFLIKTLQESNNPFLAYLSNNMYLLSSYRNHFSIKISDSISSNYSNFNNQLILNINDFNKKDYNVLIHELGHCFFTVFYKGKFPNEYINNSDKYIDKLLTYEDDNNYLKPETVEFLKFLKQEEDSFVNAFDPNQVLAEEIVKEVKELCNEKDLGEAFLAIEEYTGLTKADIEKIVTTNFYANFIDNPDDFIKELNSEENYLEKLDVDSNDTFTKSLIEVLVNYKYNLAWAEERERLVSDREWSSIAPTSDIVCAILMGKQYLDKKTGNIALYTGWHSSQYYNNSPYVSFNEQIANFYYLKTTNNITRLESLKKLLGNDWYNMMDNIYNQMTQKLEGVK